MYSRVLWNNRILMADVSFQSLKTALDAAKKGAIYFSIGAIQESEDLALHILQTLADAFGQLPYTVLWKIGKVTTINMPNNVIAHPWFPQQEVLGKPTWYLMNSHLCKAFNINITYWTNNNK